MNIYKEMESFLFARQFKAISEKDEIVYSKRVFGYGIPMSLQIYSNICPRTGDLIDQGPIKIQLWSSYRKTPLFLYDLPDVFINEAWKNNLATQIATYRKVFGPTCPECLMPMKLTGQAPHQYYSCCRYPDCNGRIRFSEGFNKKFFYGFEPFNKQDIQYWLKREPDTEWLLDPNHNTSTDALIYKGNNEGYFIKLSKDKVSWKHIWLTYGTFEGSSLSQADFHPEGKRLVESPWDALKTLWNFGVILPQNICNVFQDREYFIIAELKQIEYLLSPEVIDYCAEEDYIIEKKRDALELRRKKLLKSLGREVKPEELQIAE